MAHTGAPEFFVYRRVVYRNKTIGLEQVEEFVEEIVGVLSNELEKVMNVVAMEPSNAPNTVELPSRSENQLEGWAFSASKLLPKASGLSRRASSRMAR